MDNAKTEAHLNALDLLVEQHDTIEQLIAQLSDDRIADERKALLFRTLSDTIVAHAAAEEKIFYPAVLAKETDALVRESLHDHAAIKRELADLVMCELDDPRFAARLQILEAQLEHHARDQEEGVLFPRVRELMDDEELERLGAEMAALFEQLLSEQPALGVPRQVYRSATVHLV
ncbi:MAG TPA: hemerythrin domain-containing protein [Kofleriaceae bacterium]|nr:hemerythrin domain-containing protein [Kofleriaceae bacterium]